MRPRWQRAKRSPSVASGWRQHIQSLLAGLQKGRAPAGAGRTQSPRAEAPLEKVGRRVGAGAEWSKRKDSCLGWDSGGRALAAPLEVGVGGRGWPAAALLDGCHTGHHRSQSPPAQARVEHLQACVQCVAYVQWAQGFKRKRGVRLRRGRPSCSGLSRSRAGRGEGGSSCPGAREPAGEL